MKPSSVPNVSRSLLVLAIAFSGSSGAQPTWKRVFGGTAVEQVWGVEALSDGGFAVVGSTGSFGASSSDIYLLKLNEEGDRVWSKLIGGPQVDEGRALVEMADGGLLIAGLTNGGEQGGYDGLVVRTDVDGEVLWERTFGGPDWDMLYGVDQDGTGGAWLSGTTYSFGNGGDIWLLHLDVDGEVLFDRFYGGDTEDTGASVRATSDGGCIIGGARVSGGGDLDLHVLKVNSDGDQIWSRSFGGLGDDAARDIENTVDGGYSVLGWSRSFNPVIEQYHVKITGAGDLQWEKNWGQVNDQEGFDHLQLPTGEFASIGYVSQGGAGGKEMFLLKSNELGDFILGQTQGGTEDDLGRSIARAEGGYVLCGVTRSYGSGQWDVMAIRTNEVGFTDSDAVIEEFDPVSVRRSTRNEIMLMPNPSMGTFSVRGVDHPSTWRLLDGMGKQVATGSLGMENDVIVSQQPDGAYILELSIGPKILRTTVLIAR